MAVATDAAAEGQFLKLKQLLGLYQLARFDPNWPKDFASEGSQDPNYVPPRMNMAIVMVSVISMSLVLTIVGARLVARLRRNMRWNAFTLDDILIAISAVIAVGFTGIQIAAYFLAGGKHAYDSTFNELSAALQFAFAHLLTYIVLEWLVRMSVVLMYLRTISKGQIYMIWGLRFLLGWYTIFFMASLGATLFSCQPLPASWSLNARLDTFKCVNIPLEMLTLGAISVLNNLMLVVLPVVMLWGVEMTNRSRNASWCVLGLGWFVIACTACRTVYAHKAYTSYDFTWNEVPLLLWGQLEITFGIIAASLPALNGVLVRVHRRQHGYKRTDKWFDRNSSSSKGSSAAMTELLVEKPVVEETSEKCPDTQIRFLSAPAEFHLTDESYIDEPKKSQAIREKPVTSKKRSTPSITSSVGGGGYQAYPPRPPPPVNMSLPVIPTQPGKAVLQGAEPFITSNWSVINPTTTTIVALNQLGSDETPYAESIINSIRSSRRNERKKAGGLSRNASVTSSSATRSVMDDSDREERSQALRFQGSRASKSRRHASGSRKKARRANKESRGTFGEKQLTCPSPITENSLSQVESLHSVKVEKQFHRYSAVSSSCYSQVSSGPVKPTVESTVTTKGRSKKGAAGQASVDSLDLPIQTPSRF